MTYLFIPFTWAEDNRDLLRMAKLWQDAVLADNRNLPAPIVRWHNPVTRPLQVVQHHDPVYILAHGGPTSDYVGNRQGGLGVAVNMMSAELLAQRIHESGLPLGHVTLKLSICNIAGALGDFATLLKALLVSLGYNNIRVFYYGASVTVPRLRFGRAVRYAVNFAQPGDQGFVLEGYSVRASQVRLEA